MPKGNKNFRAGQTASAVSDRRMAEQRGRVAANNANHDHKNFLNSPKAYKGIEPSEAAFLADFWDKKKKKCSSSNPDDWYLESESAISNYVGSMGMDGVPSRTAIMLTCLSAAILFLEGARAETLSAQETSGAAGGQDFGTALRGPIPSYPFTTGYDLALADAGNALVRTPPLRGVADSALVEQPHRKARNKKDRHKKDLGTAAPTGPMPSHPLSATDSDLVPAGAGSAMVERHT